MNNHDREKHKKAFNNQFDKYKISPQDLKLVNQSGLSVFNQQVVGKPTSNLKLIVRSLFSNPYIIVATIIFAAILLTSIIVPLVSPYSELLPISSAKNNLISFLNPTWANNGFTIRSITDGQDAFIDELIQAKIISANLGHHIIDGANGSMTVTFMPWQYLNNLDNMTHFSILGTDIAGRDIWTRLWIGTRQSLMLAFLVVFVESIIGIILGAYIGFHAGSKIDTLAMRIIDIIRSVPSLIWFVLLVFILPGGFWTLFLALALVGWTLPLAKTRLYIIKVKDSEYIKAAESIGANKNQLIFRHALPNISGKLLVGAVIRIPIIIFYESSLAFLGLTSSLQNATLGGIINDAKSYIQYWWYLLSPTLIILFLTVSLQIIGNGLHDALDPEAR